MQINLKALSEIDRMTQTLKKKKKKETTGPKKRVQMEGKIIYEAQ